MAPTLARRTSLLTPSTIQYLSLLAQGCNAINLAEGFPDFPAPQSVKEAAISAIKADFNQYRHVQGACDKVAEAFERLQNVKVDPITQVTICCGQTEAQAAAIFAVVEEGDEVIIFDPAYETYEACVIMAGGKPKYVDLNPPYWTLDFKKLEEVMNTKTKALILNSPHNPTGKVFNTEELEGIARLCCQFDCFAITDEVYEHVSFGSAKHRSLAGFPGMQQRTIITSSLSKTFSVTGWRIGWAIAPEAITVAIRTIHGKLTDSAPAPFQEAALSALGSSTEFYELLKKDYTERRDFVCEMLGDAGFKIPITPQGSFFVFAELPSTCSSNDVDFVTEMIQKAGLAMVPGCVFFHSTDSLCVSQVDNYRNRYVRIAYCKDMVTLLAARTAIRQYYRQKIDKV